MEGGLSRLASHHCHLFSLPSRGQKEYGEVLGVFPRRGETGRKSSPLFRAGETAQQIRMFTAVAEDVGLDPNTHQAGTPEHPVPPVATPLLTAMGACMHTVHINSCRHVHK